MTVDRVRVVDLVVDPVRYDCRGAVASAAKLALADRERTWAPVAVIDRSNRVLDGGYLVLAAHDLGWVWMPCIRAD